MRNIEALTKELVKLHPDIDKKAPLRFPQQHTYSEYLRTFTENDQPLFFSRDGITQVGGLQEFPYRSLLDGTPDCYFYCHLALNLAKRFQGEDQVLLDAQGSLKLWWCGKVAVITNFVAITMPVQEHLLDGAKIYLELFRTEGCDRTYIADSEALFTPLRQTKSYYLRGRGFERVPESISSSLHVLKWS